MNPSDSLLFSQTNFIVYYSLVQLSPQRLHQGADGKRCSDPHPSIRQSLEYAAKEGEEGFQVPEGSKTPQNSSQNHLTWVHTGLQRLNIQPCNLHWFYSEYMLQLSSLIDHVERNKTKGKLFELNYIICQIYRYLQKYSIQAQQNISSSHSL